VLEAILPARKSGTLFLNIDPSSQVVGDKKIYDLTNRNTITNSSEIVVADYGPFNGVKSLKFDSSTGARDYFLVPASNLLNTLTGDFTVEFWFNQTNRTPGANVCLLGNWVQSVGQGGWIFWSKSGTLTFGWGPSDENGDLITGSVTHTLGTWNHLAITREGNNFRLFLNGSLIGSKIAGTTRAKISAGITGGIYQNSSGGFPDSVSKGYNGYITGVKAYAGVAKYTSNFTPAM
jgi:hypothetical protein